MSDPKAEAAAHKAKGNELYKARKFDEAIEQYQKAWDLDKDVTYLNNLGAAYFEQGKYDECIEICQKAVDEGRDMRADYKLIAKSFLRIGSAYQKKKDLENAVKFFNKSLTEHRTPDALNKLKEAEKDKVEADRLAYINPELSDQAREEGNTLFKAGNWPGAVKAYEEAIKRNPNDPRAYNNRANAYTKLMALSEALKDAEKAIEVDPDFVKAYIRKSNVYFAMKDYDKALKAIEQAGEIDKDKKNAREIQNQLRKCMEAMYSARSSETEEQTLQRAMKDPEIAAIMTDPVMQNILQSAQTDPGALREHLKSPLIAQKIQKLAEAGIIKMGPR